MASAHLPAAPAATRPAWTLAITCLTTAMLMIDLAVTAVATREIAEDLRAGFGEIQWVMVGYSVAMGSLILLAGTLTDRLGRRRVFAAGIAAFTLSSALCALAWNALVLDVFRIVQGIGGAFTFAPIVPLIAAAYPGSDRQRAIGLWSAVAGLAGLCGPLLGGVLVDTLGWRAIFWVNVPLGVLAVALLGRLPADGRRVRRRTDLLGAGLLVAGLIAINLALTTGENAGWTSPRTLAGLVGGLALVAAFLVRQWRDADPLLDPRLFRIRTFAGTAVLGFVVRFGTVGTLLFLMLYFQFGRSLSAGGTAVALLPLFLGMMPGALLAPRLLDRLAPAVVVTAGALIAAAGGGWLALVAAPDISLWSLVGPLALYGFGGGLAQTPLPGLAAGVVGIDRVGMASGVFNGLMPIGTAAGTAVLGALFLPAARSELRDAELAEPVRRQLVDALAEPGTLTGGPGGPGAAVRSAVDAALAAGLSVVMAVAAGVLMVAAVVAAVLIRRPVLAIVENHS